MADFAQLIYGTADATTKSVGQGLPEAMAKGAALALQMEELQQKKAAIAAEKEKVLGARIDKFTEALFKVEAFKDPAAKKNYMNLVIPKVRDQYGLTDVFSDDTLKLLGASDENLGRARTLTLAVQNGQLTARQAAEIANDPVKFADVTPTPSLLGEAPTIGEAQKTFLDNEAKKAQMQQQASQFQQGQAATSDRDRKDRKEKLSKIVKDSLILESQRDLNQLNAGIPGGIDGFKPGTVADIEGLTGQQGKLPSSELTGRAARNRQALQRLVNAQLKEFSGSAVMDQELARNLESMGVSVRYLDGNWTSNVITGLKSTTTPDKVMDGIRYLKARNENNIRMLKNSYGEDLYSEVTAGVKTGGSGESQQPGGGGGLSIQTLDNPQVADQVRKKVLSNPANLAPMAQRFGVTPQMLKRILEIP